MAWIYAKTEAQLGELGNIMKKKNNSFGTSEIMQLSASNKKKISWLFKWHDNKR